MIAYAFWKSTSAARVRKPKKFVSLPFEPAPEAEILNPREFNNTCILLTSESVIPNFKFLLKIYEFCSATVLFSNVRELSEIPDEQGRPVTGSNI